MTDGRLVLVFDDGYVEDHEQVAPVLDPGTSRPSSPPFRTDSAARRR